MKVCKQFSFHAAHRLPNHEGACRRPHGHSYKLEIIVDGIVKERRPEVPQSDEGMVLDFGILKDIYRKHIEPFVEHQDLNQTLSFLPVTTCEMVATWIKDTVSDRLWDEHGQEGRLGEVKVRLWETPTSYAEV